MSERGFGNHNRCSVYQSDSSYNQTVPTSEQEDDDDNSDPRVGISCHLYGHIHRRGVYGSSIKDRRR